MKKILQIILIFFFATEVFSEVNLRGRFFSNLQNKGEANLIIKVKETDQTFQTDKDGFFEAKLPSTGEYTFRVIRSNGLFTDFKKSVSKENEEITFFTDKVEKPKGGILVEGQKDKTVLSRYKVRYDEIKRMPGTLGEALNALATLPGVFAPPPFAGGGGPNNCFGGIIIRGAPCNANTYLYDDLPIFYAYHFDSFNSVIHNDLIKTIDIYTGAYPANFANATGGVIEIEATDSVKKAQGTFNLSLFLGQAMYQTPILGGKGFIAAGGKVGYLDRTFGQSGLIPDGIRLPRYTSSNVKFVYNFNPQHQISFTSLTAQDSFALDLPNKPINDPTRDIFSAAAGASLSAGQGFRTTALRYTWTPGSKFSNRMTLINYAPYVNTSARFGTIEANFQAKAPYTGVRQDAFWTATNFLKVDFGTEARAFSYDVTGFTARQRDPNNQSPNIYNTQNPDFERAEISQKSPASYYNAYTTLNFQFGNLKIAPGVRHDYVSISRQGVTGPRGVISYKFEGILKGTTVFSGAGDYFRYPFFDGAISRESGNPNIRFEKATKYGGGVEQQVNDDWSVKGEVFKQEFKDIIVNDPYISEPFGLNPDKFQRLQRPIVQNRALNYSNNGTGWSHGYEIFIKKANRPNSKDWFGWISYTWSQSFRNNNLYNRDYDPNKNVLYSADEQRLRSLFPNTKELISAFDVTHLVNVVYGWRFSEEWQFGGRWFYRTAYPYTPIIGDDGGRFSNPANGQVFWNERYSDNPYSAEYVNSRRVAPYHRLDLRFDRFINYEWGYVNVYFEIINTYIRKNVLQENFSSQSPYSLRNPQPSLDTFSLRLPSGQFIPFFNIGMEVRF
jgi:hypothetical protein